MAQIEHGFLPFEPLPWRLPTEWNAWEQALRDAQDGAVALHGANGRDGEEWRARIRRVSGLTDWRTTDANDK